MVVVWWKEDQDGDEEEELKLASCVDLFLDLYFYILFLLIFRNISVFVKGGGETKKKKIVSKLNECDVNVTWID